MSRTGKVLFSPGQIVATPAALDALALAGADILDFLGRHLTGDWGEVGAEDALENDLSLVRGLRLLSAYTLSSGTKIWIITEADRSSTCILFPEEY